MAAEQFDEDFLEVHGFNSKGSGGSEILRDKTAKPVGGFAMAEPFSVGEGDRLRRSNHRCAI